jgi:monofunctional biosynthetic peptidoglycan transglycosylase
VLGTLAATALAVLSYVYLTLPDVRVLATTNPSSTAFMELRATEAAREGRTVRRVQRWMPYGRISPSLRRAVLVAEDAAFWDHEGIDVEQIRESIRVSWEQGRAMRGASTITQQLAKNLYLSPSRDPLRKLRELIIARRLEAALPKARIFEIYLNVIEWGDGIWGAEAAARTYFGVPASALNAEQSALLAGAIINPRALNPARPTTRLRRRQAIVLGRMGDVAPPPVLASAAVEGPPAADVPEDIPPQDDTIPTEDAAADPAPESAPADTSAEEEPVAAPRDDAAP